MQAFRKFPERFEVVGYAEEDVYKRQLLVLFSGVVSACAEEIVYPMEEGITLSYAAPESAHVLALSTDWADTPFVKAWQEQTGIDVYKRQGCRFWVRRLLNVWEARVAGCGSSAIWRIMPSLDTTFCERPIRAFAMGRFLMKTF